MSLQIMVEVDNLEKHLTDALAVLGIPPTTLFNDDSGDYRNLSFQLTEVKQILGIDPKLTDSATLEYVMNSALFIRSFYSSYDGSLEDLDSLFISTGKQVDIVAIYKEVDGFFVEHMFADEFGCIHRLKDLDIVIDDLEEILNNYNSLTSNEIKEGLKKIFPDLREINNPIPTYNHDAMKSYIETIKETLKLEGSKRFEVEMLGGLFSELSNDHLTVAVMGMDIENDVGRFLYSFEWFSRNPITTILSGPFTTKRVK